jgi:hypothetical protein
MTLALADYLAVGFISLVGGWVGAFLGAYFRKKGENLATHEDINRLVDQVKATTAATEAIRSEVSGKLWETQERWKSKRQLYTDLIRSIRDEIAGWNGMWDAVGKRNRSIFTEAQYDAWMTKWGDQLAADREKIHDCYALANVVDPELADLIDMKWTETDKVDSGAGPDFLRAKAEVCDRALKAVIKRGRVEFGNA